MTEQSKAAGFRADSTERKKLKLKDRLGKYLLKRFSHEELAASMAHLILERRDFRAASIDAAVELATKVARDVTATAIFAYDRHKKKPRQNNYKGTLKPIVERSARAQEAAKQVAQELWAKDCEHQILIGAMALKVYQVLLGTEHKESLPDSDQTLRLWIRDVAPAYARRGGRPRKTP